MSPNQRLWCGGVIVRADEKDRDSSSSKLQDLAPTSGECDPICSVDETISEDIEATSQPKTDLLKTIAVLAAALIGTAAVNLSWVAANQVYLSHYLTIEAMSQPVN